MCHSNKLESVFECEVSRLLYDEGEVEYWMYEPVDLTEQSATNAATGSTMQGDLTEQSVLTSNVNWERISPPFIFLQGFQLIQKEIIIGSRENLQSVSFVKKSSTLCLVFSCIIKLILLNEMGRKYYSMINAVSRILCLDFDFPENYTHINQVLSSHSITFESFFVLVFHLCLATNIQLCFVRCTNWIANESDEMVQEIVNSHTYHPHSLLRLFTWSTGLLRTLLYN